MNRLPFALIVAVIFGWTTSAQAPAQTPQLLPAVQLRFEDTLSKTVVRITAEAEGIDGTLNGTGFLVQVPETRLSGDKVVVYLVTNRHVAKAMTPDATGRDVEHAIKRMDATVNLVTPVNGNKAKSVPLPPKGPFHWHFPSDSSIDLAVIAFTMKDEYDAERLPVSFFFTQDVWKTYRIGPGDKVLTCGYFVHYAGAHQFQPIIREGSLAMVPDDVMPVPIGGSAKIYLADLHIIPGNSGSPLFLAPSFTMGGFITDSKGGIPYGLIGVVSGYMWEDSQLTLHAATDYEGTLRSNSGIATVVPADQLKELLFTPEMQTERDAAFEDYKRKNPN
ncbi:MAG TPA: hypothetical protein VN982_01750 [Candidatus Dormibacteraeota bacterium]|nr:hypothetical protein [Candidatus Dormibacteraeota bacterium]